MTLQPMFPPMCTGLAGRRLAVYRARDVTVVEGVNEGDALGDARDLVPGDIYARRRDTAPVRIALRADRADGFRLATGTAAGRPGAAVHLDCRVTFMEDTGATREALVFVETDDTGRVAEVYLYPLAVFPPEARHVLVDVARDTLAEAFGLSGAQAGAGPSVVRAEVRV